MTSIDPVLAHGQRASTAFAAGDLDKAEHEARAALAIDPADGEIRMVLVDVLLKRGEMQSARAQIEMLPDDVQALASTRFRLARAIVVENPGQGAVIGVEACALADADHHAFVWTDATLMAANAPLEERETLLRLGTARFPRQPALASLWQGCWSSTAASPMRSPNWM